MKKPVFEGICTALVTPFLGDQLNIPMFRKLLQRQMDAGVRAITVCGTTGESPTLSDPEKLRLFREAKQWCGDHAVIVAGTGSNCTEHAVSLSRAAQDQGADALLVVTPYYNKATEQGLIAHYSAIAEAVSIPIILYNVPSRTGVDISVSVCRELSALPNIAGIKEASPDLRKVLKLRQQCPEDFYIYSGNDDLLLPFLSLGAKGLISVASNVKPQALCSIYEKFAFGKMMQAQRDFLSLEPLMEALFSEVNPIPVKAAMGEIGLDCGSCRLPLTDLSPRHRAQLKKVLSEG